jgi:hypothetical protein
MLTSLSNWFSEAHPEFLQINRFHRYFSSLTPTQYRFKRAQYSPYPTRTI